MLSLVIHLTYCRCCSTSGLPSYACDLFVGVIPWNNVTDVTVREMLVGRAPSLSVVTVPMDTAKSPYSRIENSKSSFCIIMCVVVTCPAAHCCGFIPLYVHVSVASFFFLSSLFLFLCPFCEILSSFPFLNFFP